MGYRSTFITDDWAFTFSDDFFSKYSEDYNFGEGGCLPISTKYERSRHDDDLEEDLVSELLSQNSNHRIYGVWLHEDGKHNKIVITKEAVYNESAWIFEYDHPKEKEQPKND